MGNQTGQALFFNHHSFQPPFIRAVTTKEQKKMDFLLRSKRISSGNPVERKEGTKGEREKRDHARRSRSEVTNP